MIGPKKCNRCHRLSLGLLPSEAGKICGRCILATDPTYGFVELAEMLFNEHCENFHHPLQFKILLREILGAFAEVYPPHERRRHIEATTIKYDILRAWSRKFKQEFGRSAYPTEMYDPMERSATPWMDWEGQDRRELEQALELV